MERLCQYFRRQGVEADAGRIAHELWARFTRGGGVRRQVAKRPSSPSEGRGRMLWGSRARGRVPTRASGNAMAAPLFNSADVAALIAMDKRIVLEEWQTKSELKQGRATTGWLHARVRASAPDQADVRFVVELRKSLRREEFSMTLLVSTPNVKDVAIVRYDIQTSAHVNPPWQGSQLIAPRVPHKHVYNPRAVSEGIADDWERCAEELQCPSGGTFASRVQWLRKAFLDDLGIHFDDREGRQSFLVTP